MKQSAIKRWRMNAILGLWPLLIAALWGWGRHDWVVASWWLGLAVILQAIAVSIYLGSPGRE